MSEGEGNPPIFDELSLPSTIRSRFINNVNGLRVHVLESGFESAGRPCVLLLHGFPELAYSWRKIMPSLADAGYHVIAPDQRGYGRTTGWDGDYDGDLDSFRMLNFVKDALALVSALGYRRIDAVVGHDYGSPVSGYCALIRPDVFQSVVLMSAPFAGPPSFPFDTTREAAPPSAPGPSLEEGLAALPRPRKNYGFYYLTREANANMHRAPQGVHDFLRAYYHHKSADWSQNRPHPLASSDAEVLAEMPTYYIMDKALGMAETVAAEMPTSAEIANCRWLTEQELAVYSAEYERTGFQGGLQSYRCATNSEFSSELLAFSGKTIDVPACFIAGSSDWGVYQRPGIFERMQTRSCTDFHSVNLIDGAGHWVQQEQPAAVLDVILPFLDSR